MFYEIAKRDHGLPHDPFKALVAPRPIGWITALSANGEVNLSPYSFFNAVSDLPPMVAFSSQGRKDALTFIEETGEFVCNLATWDLRGAMNETSAPLARGQNEMVQARLSSAPSRLVRPPRVADAPAALECRVRQIIPLGDGPIAGNLVIGDVLTIHVSDAVLDAAGRVDPRKLRTVARLGADFWCHTSDLFEQKRP